MCWLFDVWYWQGMLLRAADPDVDSLASRQCRCIITISKSVHALLEAQRVLMNSYNHKWCKINLRQCRCIITILKSVDAFSLSQMKKKQPQPVSMLYQNLKSQSQRVLMHNHIIKSWLKQSTINIAVHHKDEMAPVQLWYIAFLEPNRKSVVPKYAKNTYFVLFSLGVVLIPCTPCF